MKNVTLVVIGLVVMGAMVLQGCSMSQMVAPHSQVVEAPVEAPVDGGLMEKYDYLIARGDNVEIMTIQGNILPESRGYFKFNDLNDVYYDEVIIDGDIVTRFRGGSPQIMDIENLLEMVVGNHFIRDNDPL